MNTTQIILAAVSFLFAIAVVLRLQARSSLGRPRLHDAEKPQRQSPTQTLSQDKSSGSAANAEDPNLRFARRAFFQKVGGTALISFAGWMAARGADLPWAEKLALGSKLNSKSGNSRQLAQDNNTHNDSHTDSHNDIGHVDNDTHNDIEIGRVHNDIGGHMDAHIDTDHMDSHSDGNYIG